MNPAPLSVLRMVAAAVLVAAWAVAAHVGSAGRGNPDVNTVIGVLPMLVALCLALWRPQRRLLAAAGVVVLMGGLFSAWPFLRANVASVYFVQHAGINLSLAALFGTSLLSGRDALVTRLARLATSKEISVRQIRYTRQVTRAWTIFFVVNVAVSATLFVLAPVEIWSFYANILGGTLVAAMFLAEHLWRRRVLPADERPSIAAVIRAWRSHHSTPVA